MPGGFTYRELDIKRADGSPILEAPKAIVTQAVELAKQQTESIQPPLTGQLATVKLRVNFHDALAGNANQQAEAIARQIVFGVLSVSPYVGSLGAVPASAFASQERYRLGAGYAGEAIDLRSAPAWARPGVIIRPGLAVTYRWNEEQRKEDELKVQGQQLVWAGKKGPEGRTLAVDTGDMIGIFGGLRKGHGLFVLSPEGRFYCGKGVPAKFHHSSFLAGGDVVAAGEMEVTDGVLKEISNISGHYKPSPDGILLALRELERQGIDLSAVKVQATGADTDPKFPKNLTAAQFPKALANWHVDMAVHKSLAAPEDAEAHLRRAFALDPTSLRTMNDIILKRYLQHPNLAPVKLGKLSLELDRNVADAPIVAVIVGGGIFRSHADHTIQTLDEAERYLKMFQDADFVNFPFSGEERKDYLKRIAQWRAVLANRAQQAQVPAVPGPRDEARRQAIEQHSYEAGAYLAGIQNPNAPAAVYRPGEYYRPAAVYRPGEYYPAAYPPGEYYAPRHYAPRADRPGDPMPHPPGQLANPLPAPPQHVYDVVPQHVYDVVPGKKNPPPADASHAYN